MIYSFKPIVQKAQELCLCACPLFGPLGHSSIRRICLRQRALNPFTLSWRDIGYSGRAHFGQETQSFSNYLITEIKATMIES